MKAPVYIVKPKYIFKHPFNKYDLSNPTNRQTQNQELTDYFNYGFNEDTMNIYGKLVKRIIQVLDHRKNLEYFNEPSELMRLNDEIPMDFGGFCKFHDISLLNTDTNQNFHTGQSLMEYFILMVFASPAKKIDFPLIEFIKRMYLSKDEQDQGMDNRLFEIVEQIGRNIQKKYEETLKKLREQKMENKPQQPLYKKKPFNRQNDMAAVARSEVKQEVKKEKEEKSESSSGSDSSSDDSSDSSEGERKKRSEKRSRSEKKSSKKDKKKKDKSKTKTKKVKKDKSKKKSRSRSRDRDHKKKHK